MRQATYPGNPFRIPIRGRLIDSQPGSGRGMVDWPDYIDEFAYDLRFATERRLGEAHWYEHLDGAVLDPSTGRNRGT